MKRIDRTQPIFQVEVSYADNKWIAECEELGIVTEADSYEALTQRVWAVAPEMCELNGRALAMNSFRLSFTQLQSAEELLSVM